MDGISEGQTTSGGHAVAEPVPHISAIWTRDGRRWQLDPSLRKLDLPASDAPAAKGDLLLTDIAPLPLADEETEPQFFALWCEAPDPVDGDVDAAGSRQEQRRLLVVATEVELMAAQDTFTKQGFSSQCTITVRTDSNGQRHYTAIWSNAGAPSEVRPAYAGFELVEQPQWDVAVAPAGELPDPRETFRQRISAITHEIEASPANRQLLQTRGQLYYFCWQDELAIQDFDALFASGDRSELLLRFRTFVLSRLGRVDDAVACRQLYLDLNPDVIQRMIVQVTSAAWLGNEAEALEHLTDFLAVNGDAPNALLAAAAASSLASLPGKFNADGSAVFRGRAIDLLYEMIRAGFDNIQMIKTDPNFVPLHDDSRFLNFLSQMEPPAAYAALWRADVEFESKLLPAVPPEQVLDQLEPLLAAGYRPFAVAVNPFLSAPESGETVADQPGNGSGIRRVIGEAITSEQDENRSSYSLVLHRPLIPDAAQESLAIAQAAAATALLRLGTAEKVWPLLQDQPDPRVRSYLLHRLATYGLDPQSWITQLQNESDAARQRSLILGIGEFARARLLSPEQQTAAIADLTKRYADDPDPGIHGTADWTRRQLGADAAMTEVRAAFSTGAAVGDRRWYLTKTGSKSPGSSGLSFVILHPEEEFLMGSPVSEFERANAPIGKNEIRHRRRIGRRFAIGAHEVTAVQFQAFRNEYPIDRTKDREEDTPANSISWYDAAAYCNWLSEQEGIPREQWCYDPSQPIAEGMPLVSDHLARTGYRLPTEAEWEYACRAGTTTARYFGETEKLLAEYAWYAKKTSAGKNMLLPVGILKPNGAGLFDMQGNMVEWCQEQFGNYEVHSERMSDRAQVGRVSNNYTRVARGGSNNYGAATSRSAWRTDIRPDLRFDDVGFRVGRTLDPLPLTADEKPTR